MYWVIPTLVALFITIIKEIFKKNVLNRTSPIQFLIVFYVAMFLYAQVTIDRIVIPTISEFGLIILASFCYFFANLLGLKVLKDIRISVFKPVSGLSAVFVVLFAMLFLQETLTRTQGFGIILALLPIVYISMIEYYEKELDVKHAAYLLIAFVFEAAAVMFDRIVLRTVNVYTYFYFMKALLIIYFICVMYAFYSERITKSYLKTQSVWIGLLAFITTIGSYAYFFAISNPLAHPGVVKVIISSEIIFTTLVGGLYFKEKHIVFKGAVAACSLVGIIVLILA
ncbi:MAG TPA: EamA family transporter [Candidatus Nanoarchaeia archaeon]|nr:EamA family transporter [Candidatus Nanoarchaeia archaeon]